MPFPYEAWSIATIEVALRAGNGTQWYSLQCQQYDIVMSLTMPLLCIALNFSVSKLPSLPLYS